MREPGGRMRMRSTGVGAPFSSSTDTSASPVPSWVMAVSVSTSGFWRKVSATTFTALRSLGVKARSACWILAPSWPRMSVGMSSGLWVMK